ncbi:hypothetical protein [Microvirga sp. VF16]|uniref:hypothetical protein n=1 Tax=Microvirga sp. VF16 TaxID=2807101 RepID=UPI00193EB7CB|nr:hypothetical protein [Microvirga sp. VF16]QRM35986.1 hypothetical protein JO965_47305 [Microvirga sp. VF16]
MTLYPGAASCVGLGNSLLYPSRCRREAAEHAMSTPSPQTWPEARLQKPLIAKLRVADLIGDLDQDRDELVVAQHEQALLIGTAGVNANTLGTRW